MKNNIKFVHTNIIAHDWQKLAQFYIDVFGCKPIYPERNLKGDWVNKLTNISRVHLKGIHLSLPGYRNGPTLEIFGYNVPEIREKHPNVNAQGFGHIAFHVDNVELILEKLIEKGGSKYGELVQKYIDGLGILKVVYAKDPEGNIIEIQNWRPK